MDVSDRPCCETSDYALRIVDALSVFCHVVRCRETIDAEGVLGAILRRWIHIFQPMVKIHSEQGIRITRELGRYLNAFRVMGIEVTFGQPYRPQSNRLCQGMSDEYQETLRILSTSIKTSQCVQLNDCAMVLMNNNVRGKLGI